MCAMALLRALARGEAVALAALPEAAGREDALHLGATYGAPAGARGDGSPEATHASAWTSWSCRSSWR